MHRNLICLNLPKRPWINLLSEPIFVCTLLQSQPHCACSAEKQTQLLWVVGLSAVGLQSWSELKCRVSWKRKLPFSWKRRGNHDRRSEKCDLRWKVLFDTESGLTGVSDCIAHAEMMNSCLDLNKMNQLCVNFNLSEATVWCLSNLPHGPYTERPKDVSVDCRSCEQTSHQHAR
jgi:hypothetical protein